MAESSLIEPGTGSDIPAIVAKELKNFKPGPNAPDEFRAFIEVLQRTGPSDAAALASVHKSNVASLYRQVSTKYVKALGQAGLDEAVADLMKSWLGVMLEIVFSEVETSAPKRRAPLAQHLRPIAERDTTEMLTARELGNALGGVTDETVRLREKAGELFSILPPGRKRGRAYPAFQAWHEVAGDPMKEVLSLLAPSDGSAALAFFTAVTDLLAGLTPLECLIGQLTSERTVDDDAEALLGKSPKERLAAVLEAAQTHADIWAV